MHPRTDDESTDAVADLQPATDDLDEPIRELTAQLSTMTERMSRIADAFAALNDTHRDPTGRAGTHQSDHAVADD